LHTRRRREEEATLMEIAEIEEKTCKILAENLSVPEDQVTPASRFQEDLDADSLDLVEAVLALEEEFGVSIPEEEMEGVKTVGQAIQLVASKLGVSA
jgi:acyl carrier protein